MRVVLKEVVRSLRFVDRRLNFIEFVDADVGVAELSAAKARESLVGVSRDRRVRRKVVARFAGRAAIKGRRGDVAAGRSALPQELDLTLSGDRLLTSGLPSPRAILTGRLHELGPFFFEVVERSHQLFLVVRHGFLNA